MVKLARSIFGGQLRTCDVTVYASHSCFTWLTRESCPKATKQWSVTVIRTEHRQRTWRPPIRGRHSGYIRLAASQFGVFSHQLKQKHTFSTRWCTVMMRLMRREFEAIIHLKGVEHDTWRDRPDLFTVNRCNYKHISVLCHWSLVENGSQMVKYLRSISRR